MLFVYDSTRFDQMNADLGLTRHRTLVKCCGLTEKRMRVAMRTLANHDLMLVPTDTAHHTEVVERMKRIALNAGIRFESIDTWYRRTQLKENNATGRSAVGHAVPPTWHAPTATANTTSRQGPAQVATAPAFAPAPAPAN